MKEPKYYLKPNVVIEPLVGKWYAWSHLISPATAAMNVNFRHLPIIDSYLLSPKLHAKAVQNSKMKGGPFMDFSEDRKDDIKLLKINTLSRQSQMIDLANAIKELDEFLLNEAEGYGLETLYERIPEILRGYVELFYDRNNNPGFRFFESLLYKSEYYDKREQSIALWLTNNDHRPFCLSTPRLEEPEVIHLPIAFDSDIIDQLTVLKKEPRLKSQISELLDIPENKSALFDSFFTEEKPREYDRYSSDKIRMRYMGHACILLETKEVSILVDPLISYYGYPSEVNHFSYEDLPETIDYVLITHNHQDHILFETLLALRYKIKHIVIPSSTGGLLEDPDLKLMFHNMGFNNVVTIDEMATIDFGDLTIQGLPFIGEHSDLNIQSKSCYLVKVNDFSLMFMADSRVMEPMLYQRIHDQIGNIDVIFLGMECDGAPLSWLYGPLMTQKLSREKDENRRLAGSDYKMGVSIVDIFQPKEVYVYAMGQEPWIEYISSIKYTDDSNPIVQSNKLVEYCQNNGIVAERLFGEKELLYSY